MTQLDKPFCPLPWVSYALRADGHVRVCCHANQSPSRGILLKDNGEPYTYKDDIDELRNSITLRKMRMTFLDGKWPSECIRCRLESEAKLDKTRPLYEREKWQHLVNIDIAKKITSVDGSVNNKKFPARSFDLRFGNLCNLKCRMCSPYDSDSWYKDWVEALGINEFILSGGVRALIEKNKKGKYYINNSPFDWHKDETFWVNLEKQIENIDYCYLVGGEPLLIKKHYYFLQKCIDLGCAKNMTIEYNTNFSFVPDYALNLWKEFKYVNFGVSVDGIEKYNDYIRYPSKWTNTLNNLHKFKGTMDNMNLWLSFTLSVYNVLHLPEMLEWKLEQKLTRIDKQYHSMLSTHPLHRPEYLSIKIFPEESKKFISQYYTDKIRKMKETNYSSKIKDKYERILTTYITFMYQDDLSHLIPKFWKFNNSLDKIRNQKLEEYIPELRKLLQ